MRTVDRASPTDMVSLASDTVTAPMQVGAVVVLTANQPPDLAAIEAAISQRIQAVPRLRQRLVRVPLRYGRPIWVDDTKFDIARHLRRRAFSRLPRLVTTIPHAIAELATKPAMAENCSLNAPTGPRRQPAVVRTDLTRIHETAHQCGGTINDALLAAVAGALQTLLAGRGEHIDTLVMSVPVSARRSATSAELGNNAGMMQVAVPATGDARSRTSQIATIVHAHKGPAPIAFVDPAFRALGALGLLGWVMNHQRILHTFVTNLHGPEQPVTLGGAKVSAVIPVSATTGNVTLAFAALSYGGTLSVTVIADPDHVPDMPILTAALQAELDTLTSGSSSDRAAQ